MQIEELPADLHAEIARGHETNRVEFKAALGRDGRGQVPESVYETVSAFANRLGGNIYFGVDDAGRVLGINAAHVARMRAAFTAVVTSAKFQPGMSLSVNAYQLDNRIVLQVHVPQSKQIVRYNNQKYVRRDDADIVVK